MTIEDIKFIARKLKKEKGVKHAEALDLAAAMKGYQNYAHARRVLGDLPQPAPEKHR